MGRTKCFCRRPKPKRPKSQQPRVVSSMNTDLAGSSRPCLRIQRCRDARKIFFEVGRFFAAAILYYSSSCTATGRLKCASRCAAVTKLVTSPSRCSVSNIVKWSPATGITVRSEQQSFQPRGPGESVRNKKTGESRRCERPFFANQSSHSSAKSRI